MHLLKYEWQLHYLCKTHLAGFTFLILKDSCAGLSRNIKLGKLLNFPESGGHCPDFGVIPFRWDIVVLDGFLYKSPCSVEVVAGRRGADDDGDEEEREEPHLRRGVG